MRLIVVFVLMQTFIFSQKLDDDKKLKFNHVIGLNAYSMNLDFYADNLGEFTHYGGSELLYRFELQSAKNLTYYLKTGFFYYKAKSEEKLPDLNYSYFPLGGGVKYNFKKKPFIFIDLNVSMPILSYEDSKNIREYKLWLNYEEAIYYNNLQKKKNVLIQQFAFGFTVKNKLFISVGEIGYFTSIKEKSTPMFTPGFMLGVSYKFL